jgi:hypothetical protein
VTDLHDLNTRNEKKGKTGGIRDCGIEWYARKIDKDICGLSQFKPFWMCWVVGNVCAPFDASYAHYDLEEAQIEAERLSRLPANKMKEVYLLECIGKCKVDPLPVVWEWPEWPDEE